MSFISTRARWLSLTFCMLAVSAAAEQSPAPQPDAERFAVHAQFTYVEQETSNFDAPYRGANSLSPDIGDETTDATLYLGARLWPGAQAWINGELDQGFGLDDTLGRGRISQRRGVQSRQEAALLSAATALSCARVSIWAGNRSQTPPRRINSLARTAPTVW